MKPAPPFSVEARKRDARFVIFKQNEDGSKGAEVAWVYAESLEAATNAAMIFFRDILIHGVVIETVKRQIKKSK